MLRSLPARISLAAIAASAALAISGFIPNHNASADQAQLKVDDSASFRGERGRLRAELRAYKEAYAEAMEGLEQVERLADRMHDRRARQFARIADRAQDRAADEVRDYDDDRDDYDDYDGNEQRPLSDREFQTVYQKVAATSFADDQLALIRSVAKSSYFTIDQAVKLMKACSFDDTRIEIAVVLYPRIVDRREWYRLEDGLNFSSSKQTLRSRIGQ